MDTRWRVIRLYVGSILTVVIAAVGIPIALSFGLAEDTSLYDAFYTTLKSLFDIHLSTFIIESDQGSALRAVCAKYRNRHLACLRHLFVSLRRGPYVFETGNLVQCRGDDDFTTLKIMCEKRLSSLEKQELDQLSKAVRKDGLCFAEGKIVIENRERWQEVSMKKSMQTGMSTIQRILLSLTMYI
jgi:hypothetical protein